MPTLVSPEVKVPERAATVAVAEAAPAMAHQPSRRGVPRRGLIFAVVCAICLMLTVGSIVLARMRSDASARTSAVAPPPDGQTLQSVSSQPHLVFLQTPGDANRKVTLVGLDLPDGPRTLAGLDCQRVAMAAGQGLCLGQTTLGGAFTFNAGFEPRHYLSISGIPSRARVSPDGRYGAMTVFVKGHSYAAGSFSTQTTLVDMATGAWVGAPPGDNPDARPGLEGFSVTRAGAPFQGGDFNFWGVTFARDSDRFYATLGTGGKTYLLEGSVSRQEARVLLENVECPSLSPDNSRLIFKKRVSGGGLSPTIVWRLTALDLQTMAQTPLAETRNVDDQVEWLDDEHILYALQDEGPPPTIRPDIWMLPLSGGTPRVYQYGAVSPIVVR